MLELQEKIAIISQVKQQIQNSINLLQDSINSQKNTIQHLQQQQNVFQQQLYSLDRITLSDEEIPEALQDYIQSLIFQVEQNVYERLKIELSSGMELTGNQTNTTKRERINHEQKISDQSSGNFLEQLISDYNQLGITFIYQYQVTEVDETQGIAETRRSNQSNTSIVLLISTPGKFLVVNNEEYNYLIPNPGELFNKYSLDLLKDLFLFAESNHYPGCKIVLVSPAIISLKAGDNRSWQLEEKGIISFT
jgi:hypothetical protein